MDLPRLRGPDVRRISDWKQTRVCTRFEHICNSSRTFLYGVLGLSDNGNGESISAVVCDCLGDHAVDVGAMGILHGTLVLLSFSTEHCRCHYCSYIWVTV